MMHSFKQIDPRSFLPSLVTLCRKGSVTFFAVDNKGMTNLYLLKDANLE